MIPLCCQVNGTRIPCNYCEELVLICHDHSLINKNEIDQHPHFSEANWCLKRGNELLDFVSQISI